MDRDLSQVADDRTSTFELEMVDPTQYFGVIAGGSGLRPEQRLMLAVLDEALGTLRRHVGSRKPRSKRLVDEVGKWLASTAETGPFSFVAICGALDFDPDYLRAGIARWKATECRRATSGGPRPYWWSSHRMASQPRKVAAAREYQRKSA